MSIQDQAGIRPLETEDDFSETRIEAIGFIFHGALATTEGRRPAIKPGSNLLHFARCVKLDKAGESEAKIWFRTVGHAKEHLDEAVGGGRWKWCKLCEREVTQRVLNER